MMDALISALLVSGLVFPGISAYTAVYVVLGILIVFLVRTDRAVLCSPIVIALGIGAMALLLSILLNGARGPDWLALVLVVPFLGVLPAGSVLGRIAPVHFATLCLLGALAGLAVGVVDVFALEASRAGGGNNPIHYASLVSMLGFVSLLGLAEYRHWSRAVFVLGPIAASGAVLLSGSRGPLLAICVMWVASVFALRRDRMAVALLTILPLLVVLAILAGGEGQRAISTFSGPFGEATAFSDSQRLMMYQAASDLFLASPIWGHGVSEVMPSARALYSISNFDNLHSDLANFAAAGGLLGLTTYLALVFSPLLVLLRPGARGRPAVVILALSICLGNAVLGLTNAIIGLLPQTTLYVLMLGYLVALDTKGHEKPDKPVT